MNRLPEKIKEITPDVVRRELMRQIKACAAGDIVDSTRAAHIPPLCKISNVGVSICVREYLEGLLGDALGLMGLLSLNEERARKSIRSLFPLFYERAELYGWRAMDAVLFLKKCQTNTYPYLGELSVFKSALFFKAMAQYHADTLEHNAFRQNKLTLCENLGEESRKKAAEEYYTPSPAVVAMRKKIAQYKKELAKKMKVTGIKKKK